MTFKDCNIFNGTTINLQESYVRIEETTIQNFFQIKVENDSYFDCVASSTIQNIAQTVEVNSNSFLNVSHSTFTNTQVIGDNNPVLIFKNSTIKDKPTSFAILIKDGYYTGKNNLYKNNGNAITTFENSDGSFISIDEQNSTFENHALNTIELENISNVVIKNNTFLNNNTGNISVNNGNGGTGIENNTISGGTSGIGVHFRTSPLIRNNTISNIESVANGIDGVGITVTMSNNLTLEGSRISNILDSDGIRINGCINAFLSDNIAHDGINNIEILSSDNIEAIGNIGGYATGTNIYIEASDNSEFCGNSAFSGNHGIKFSGISNPMLLTDNHMSSCNIGLVYGKSVITSAQIEQGNDFSNNNLGAHFIKQTNPTLIDMMKYVVLNNSAEFPTHIPNNWFDNTANNSAECAVINFAPPNSTEREAQFVNLLSSCARELSLGEMPDGQCLSQIKKAIEVIENNPVLLADPEISNFCNRYCNSAISTLPKITEISNDMVNDLSLPSLDLNIDHDITSIMESYSNYLTIAAIENTRKTQEKNQRLALLSQRVNQTTTSSDLEEYYKLATRELIEIAKGNNLSSENTEQIRALANSCVEIDGPAVYVARIVADIANIAYVITDNCTLEVGNRSNQNKASQAFSQDIKISPNPVSELLTISTALDESLAIIYDVSGKVHVSKVINKQSTIDISKLPKGVYFIKFKGQATVLKFIKI